MRIYFFEVQEIEKEYIAHFFHEHNYTLVTEPLTEKNAGNFADADIISIFLASTINDAVLDTLSSLKYITTRSTGFDHVDCIAARDRNIGVSYAPDYCSHTVAEFTMGLMLHVSRNISQAVMRTKKANFEHIGLMGSELFDKMLGIVGLGNIGRQVALRALSFGMKIIGYDPYVALDKLNFDITLLDSVEALFGQADIITLHTPLNDATRYMVSDQSIQKFKKGVILINAARGGLVDNQALLHGLEMDIIAAAGLDVIDGEKYMMPEVSNSTKTDIDAVLYMQKVIHHPRVIVTPHIAYYSEEAVHRMIKITCDTIYAALHGTWINAVPVCQSSMPDTYSS